MVEGRAVCALEETRRTRPLSRTSHFLWPTCQDVSIQIYQSLISKSSLVLFCALLGLLIDDFDLPSSLSRSICKLSFRISWQIERALACPKHLSKHRDLSSFDMIRLELITPVRVIKVNEDPGRRSSQHAQHPLLPCCALASTFHIV